MSISSEQLASFFRHGAWFSPHPDHILLAIGVKTWSRSPWAGHYCFYAPDFFLEEETPWLIPEFVQELNSADLLHQLQQDPPAKPEIDWHPPEQQPFRQDFFAIQERIRQGELLKAVPIVVEHGRVQTDDRFKHYLFQALLQVTDPLRLYGLWDLEQGIIGGTPETLLLQEHNTQKLITVALAGTRPRLPPPSSSRPALLADPKEQQEHAIVVDHICKIFQPFGQIDCAPTRVLTLSLLEHLETRIHIQLHQPMALPTLIQLLHPTPALGVAPKTAESLAWLKGLNYQAERQRFGAPFGLLRPDGSFHAVVAIRNLQWQCNALKLAAGCGVVASSQLQQEWQELNSKRNFVKAMLQL
jgi:menaquinone-specific isochorismate synthase